MSLFGSSNPVLQNIEQKSKSERKSKRFGKLQTISGVLRWIGIALCVIGPIAFFGGLGTSDPEAGVIVTGGIAALVNGVLVYAAGKAGKCLVATEQNTREIVSEMRMIRKSESKSSQNRKVV